MLGRLLDVGPIDTLRVAQVLVLQYSYRPRVDLLERSEAKRDQRRLHHVQRREVIRQASSPYHLQIAEVRQILEILMIPLNV